MTPIGKVVALVTGVSTIGGGVGLSVHMLNKYPTLSERLKNEGFELSVTDEEWRTILTAHNEGQKTNIFKEKKDDLVWLKDKCKEALNKESKDETNYKLARQWCVKPETMSTILGRKNRVLGTEAGITDKGDWNPKISALTQNEKTALDIEIKNVENDDITAIKGKCQTLLAKKTTDVEFESKFELVRKICTVEKAQQTI